MHDSRPLREAWPWNAGYKRLYLGVPTLFGVLASAALYPHYGVHALWFLTALGGGLLLWLMFGVVGRRVAAEFASLADGEGEAVEGLLVVGLVESPGVVVLRANALLLAPIAGEHKVLPFADIVSYSEGRWLPGKYLWGKRAFILATEPPSRCCFAVADSVGRRWSVKLRLAGIDKSRRPRSVKPTPPPVGR